MPGNFRLGWGHARRPRPEEGARMTVYATSTTPVACARLESLPPRRRGDEDGPGSATASCFETHRSASCLLRAASARLRCDAPQHEAVAAHHRGRASRPTRLFTNCSV